MAWIKRAKTMQRYGVCRRTVERWEADLAMAFPKSRIINGRKYDNEEALDAWDASCAAAGRGAVQRPPSAGHIPQSADCNLKSSAGKESRKAERDKRTPLPERRRTAA
jgi:hypothetical protein